MTCEIKYKLLAPHCRPQRMTDGAAGWDLCARTDALILPNCLALVSLGVAFEIPTGWAGYLYPRSSLYKKTRTYVPNSVGVIDSDYRGELKLQLISPSHFSSEIKAGQRIAQIIFQRTPEVFLTGVSELSETVRGGKGFGSTGQ